MKINCKESSSAGEQLPESQSGRAARRGGEHERLPDNSGVLRFVTQRISIGVIDKRVEALINQLAGHHGEVGSDGNIAHDRNRTERELIERELVRAGRLFIICAES